MSTNQNRPACTSCGHDYNDHAHPVAGGQCRACSAIERHVPCFRYRANHALPTRFDTAAQLVPASVTVSGLNGEYHDPEQLRQAAASLMRAADRLDAAHARPATSVRSRS